jgi:GTP-binding protein
MISGLVAIIGRPNVGKSTLFNRLTRSDTAIVDDRPGVTRDRLYGTAWLDDERTSGFGVIDTGGFETDDFKFQPFAENLVWRQTDAAIKEADVVLLVVDGKSGINPHDHELARYLEKLRKPYLVVVNKIDGVEYKDAMWDFYELGTERLWRTSAAHNRGIGELVEAVADELVKLPGCVVSPDWADATRIAIIGRPNAGKSSILNRLCGEERAVVSNIAGTTRDNVDTPLVYNGKKFLLIDTAGIRRKSKVLERLESMSVMRALRAIDRADVVFLVLDAVQGLTDQDMRLSELAAERHKPIAIVVNKWDLFENKTSNTAKEYQDAIHHHLRTLSFAPVAFVSCLENLRVHSLLKLAERLSDTAARRVETAKVNAALRQIVQEHTPALIKGKTKRIKFYFATQVAIHPPTVVIFCNVYDEIQESYIRYMRNRFRSMLGFDEIPIRLIFRPKTETRARDRRAADDLVPLAGEEADHYETIEVDAYGPEDEADDPHAEL